MEFEKPSTSGFTIYSKSGCPGCMRVKSLLMIERFRLIDCDEYMFEDKDSFLLFIKSLAGQDVKIFPMVFYDSKFIGGYQETQTFLTQKRTPLGIAIDNLLKSPLDFSHDF